MPKLKRAFQLLAAGTPQRDICTQLHMGRGVLSRYKSQAEEQKLSFQDLARMSNEEIESFLKSTKPEQVVSAQKEHLDSLIPDYAYDLSHNRYLTIQRLHERYKQENPDGYEYTQFKKFIRDYQYAHNLSYHNEYVPGDEMQIDFAGDSLWLTDPLTGEIAKVVVLVCVLPFCGVGFIKAMPDSTMEHFFSGISDAFTFYGGTTRIAKSDNMKQWVKKHDRYEPVFNDAAMEWGAYYDISLETCRVKHPRDKGPVEGSVQKVYNAVYCEVHNEVFFSIEQMNGRFSELMDIYNHKVSRTTGKSKWDVFVEEEQPCLNPLPETPYRFRYRKEVKLTGTYHIEVTKHKYSVPYQYVGLQIVVLWDTDTVEVYSGQTRIAIHVRSFNQGYTTLDEHMPPRHLEYKHGQGRNAAYYLEEAMAIGEYTHKAVEKILSNKKHVVQSYKSCQGVLSLRKQYSRERMESACKRLSECSSVSYTMIKNVLQSNLDLYQVEEPVSNTPTNDYVRGAETFIQILTASN